MTDSKCKDTTTYEVMWCLHCSESNCNNTGAKISHSYDYLIKSPNYATSKNKGIF